MEPVGIAASLLTLIAVSKKVADTGLVLVRRYRGYPAAQAVIRDRSTQLDVQLSLLSDAKKAISELDILSDELKKKILEAVGDTCVTLKLIRDDLAQHSDERGTRARIRYAQRGEAEFQDWFKKLDENYQALTYKFSILNIQLSAHSVKVSEACDAKLALIIKNQDANNHERRAARSRNIRNKVKKAAPTPEDAVLWGLLLRLPTDIRYLAFMRNYKVQFNLSVLYKPIIPHNIIPHSAEIFEACKCGDALGVKQLLDTGKASARDATPRGSTPLRFAIESGSRSLVQLLIDYGADPDVSFGQMPTSPIAWAFAARKLDIARLLYSRGADIDSPNAKGWTPLFYLFGSIGNPELAPATSSDLPFVHESPVVEYLQFLCSASLQDIDAQDSRGWASLHRAAIHGQGSDILEFIREHASLSLRTKPLQWSPIFMAVHSSNMSTFNVLADHQPGYINEKDIQSWTLLHVAVKRGCKKILERLLRNGADVHALTDVRATIVPERLRGRQVTPLDVAKVSDGDALAIFLEVLCEWNKDVNVIWEGDDCDVFYPSTCF